MVPTTKREEPNLLAQAEIVKLLLSNRLLKDGTIQYSYVKPFDVLVELTRGQVWWAHPDLNGGPAGYEPAALTN